MRPRRLELEGFTSFRERAVIDFDDAELFVLSGPMGAGKSSVIDALGFALYGSVARFQSRSVVAPVISQGLQEARVRLDFSLGGEDYSAIRVVRRSRTGSATTPEARLLHGEALLADDAATLSAKVEELLGLNFDQFTKCVVLPQGDFAELLHAKPSERQDLLVRLLDIGLYRRIGERARSRVTQGDAISGKLRERLEGDLRLISQQAFDEQEQRVERLGELQAQLDQEELRIQELTRAADEHRAVAEKTGGLITLLSSVTVPSGAAELVERLHTLEAAEQAAQEREQQAAESLEALEQQRAQLPDRGALEVTINTYRERATVRKRIGEAETALAQAEPLLAAAEQELAALAQAFEAAEAEHRRLERADSAYHASRGLKAGDVCPICGEVLTAAPELAVPAGVAAAATAVAAARKRQNEAENRTRTTRDGITRLRAGLEKEQQRLEELNRELTGQMPGKEAMAALEQVRLLETEIEAKRQLERQARQAHQSAQKTLAAAKQEEQQAWSQLYRAREQLAALGAPEPTASLQESWQSLAGWAATAVQEQQQHQQAAALQEQAVRQQLQQLREQQTTLCQDAGVIVSSTGTARDAVIAARAAAQQSLQYIDERLTQRLSVESELETTVSRTATARLLGTHLDSRHFERWYLQEALARLVQGATERLKELTDGQYSLAVSARGDDFVVVDHLNANDQRPVRTLSGGETFLASLSLALALGDDIASLAARGAARLDALFLDEGFGSLDQNTLETVASTIEELGARGRMVGIITHVQELADRVPVQFRVSKLDGTSRVERVEQA